MKSTRSVTVTAVEGLRQRYRHQGPAAAHTAADNSVLPNPEKHGNLIPVRTCRTSRRRHRPPLNRTGADGYPTLTTRGRPTGAGTSGSALPTDAPTQRKEGQTRGQAHQTKYAPRSNAQNVSSNAATTDRSPSLANTPAPSRTHVRTTIDGTSSGGTHREGAPTLNRQPPRVADEPAAADS